MLPASLLASPPLDSKLIMRLEIRSASDFLMNILRLGRNLDSRLLDVFRGTLEDLLRHHYQHHWFPEMPTKGSGYRCIRINHKMDPILAKAGRACGLQEASLRELLPNELTLWVDPREVSYRIGENGSICVLYEGSSVASHHHLSSSSNHGGHHYSVLTNSPQGALSYHHQHNNHLNNHPHHHHHQGYERIAARPAGCKGSWDADPRNINFEPMATYVSS